jgi:asparagine synthase (glutamine-hydrolysing)
LGVKPFYYYQGKGLAIIASEPPAIASHPKVPYRLNEARIADFLVNPLEGVDKTSTFFEGVFRLPPGHSLEVTPASPRVCRYWQPQPRSELRLPDDQAYAEGFLDVLTKAVRCRLRGGARVGSMLSGGVDSGSIVAIGRTLLKQEMGPPLRTFSGVAADPVGCVETKSIAAVQAMGGIEPVNIRPAQLSAQVPGILDATWSLDEPFDNHMTLQRALYVAARDGGLKALLDGVGGDIVLSAGQHVARLLRSGRWWAAAQEASGQIHFYGQRTALMTELYHNGRVAFVPQWARRLRARHSVRAIESSLAGKIRSSLINPEFARRIGVSERLQRLASLHPGGIHGNSREELARNIAHPFLTVGRERYERVASALGIEPRDPFLDVRVVDFVLSLPPAQRQHRGWPKVILRRAMSGMLPDEVRWRRGKEHLGRAFSLSLMSELGDRMRLEIDRNRDTMAKYVDMHAVDAAAAAYMSEGDPEQAERFYDAVHLAAWLHRFGCRPRFGDALES